MNRFVVALSVVACAYGAPSHPAVLGGATHHLGSYASAPVAVGQTHHSYPAGPAVVEQHTEYGVIGHQTVQVGTKQVQAGHQYVQTHQEVIPQPAVSHVAQPAQNLVETRALPAPVLPSVPLTAAVIPPAPVNHGPAPADTVTSRKIAAPVRTHTRITPVQTNIVPELQVNKYNVDVPVNVPVPVEREVVVTKHVARPYNVEVPRPVAVPAPYKVHPVHEIVEQPHIHTATYTHHSSTPVVTAHATPVVTGLAHGAVAYNGDLAYNGGAVLGAHGAVLGGVAHGAVLGGVANGAVLGGVAHGAVLGGVAHGAVVGAAVH